MAHRRRIVREQTHAGRTSTSGVARARWLYAAAIVLLGVLTYGNSLTGPLIFDDDLSIAANPQIRQIWPLSGLLAAERESPVSGRPVVAFSFAVNYAISELDVRGYHATNIAIHILCALLLFGVVRRTFDSPRLEGRLAANSAPLAFCCALVWMVHPLQTEAVDYLSQRTESMMALFYLLTLYASVRAHRSPRAGRWQMVAIVSCILGMGSKESMVTAPLIVVLYDSIFVFGSPRQALAARWRFYSGLAATAVALPILAWAAPPRASAGFSTGISPWTYLLNQAVMIARYLYLTVWPRSLVLDYGVPRALALGDVLPQVVLVAFLVLLSVAGLVFRPTLGFLGAWFFVTLAPASSVVPIATEVGAERRMYLPLAAVAVLLVITVDLLWERLGGPASRRTATVPPRAAPAGEIALLILLSGVLAAGTVLRNREYASAVALAQTVVERWPHGRAHHLLAVQLMKAGRRDEAIRELRAAISDDPTARYSLGVELFNDGRMDEATQHLSEFLRLAPAVPQALDARSRLAGALFAERKFEGAAAEYREFLKARPNDFSALTNLAISLASTGHLDEAIAAFRRAVEADPTNSDGYRNLAKALQEKGDFEGAALQAQHALDLKPGEAEVHNLLGIALASERKLDAAIVQFQQALQLDPENIEARQNLAFARRERDAGGSVR